MDKGNGKTQFHINLTLNLPNLGLNGPQIFSHIQTTLIQ